MKKGKLIASMLCSLISVLSTAIIGYIFRDNGGSIVIACLTAGLIGYLMGNIIQAVFHILDNL